MPTPDDLLAALDPEQRQVAEALRGPGAGARRRRAPARPGRSPTASRYGVATGVYAPTEVLAVTFTTRAAGEMRARLRVLGRRRASRPAPSTPPRCASCATSGRSVHGTELPTLIESKIGLLATAARRQRLNADQALLRDLASEIEWAKVSNVHPDDYAAGRRRRAAARSTGQDPDTVGRVFGTYEDVKRSQGRMDMEDVLLLTAGPARRGRAGRRPGPPAVQMVRRRRVPGRLAAPVGAARPVARRPRRALRGRRPGPDDLLLRRRQRRLPPRLPGASSPAPPRSSWSATTAPRPRSSTAANTLLAGIVQPRASSCAPSGPPGPQVDLHRPPRRGRRGRRPSPARIQRLRDAGPLAGRDRGAVPHQRPVRGLRGRAGRHAASPTSSAAPPASSTGPRSARPSPGCAAPPGRARPTAPTGWSRPSAAPCPGMGWTAEAPDRARPDPRPLGVLAGAGRPGDRVRAGRRAPTSTRFVDDLDRRAAEQHAPVADGVTLATFHAAKGLEWDSVFLVRAPGRHAADHLRRHPGRGRGGAPAALRRHDPRPASTSRCPGRWRATPAAAPPASRRGSSTPLLPDDHRAAAGLAAQPQGGELPRVRPAAEHRRGEEARPVRRLPGVVRRGAVRAPARVAQATGPREESVPAFVVFTDATLQLIAEHKPRHARGAAAHQRDRPVQAREVRRRGARAGRLSTLPRLLSGNTH